MRLRLLLKQSDTLVGVVKDLRKLRGLPVHARSRRLIARYLAQPPPRRLQLGAGHNPLPGWLSTDLTPAQPGIAILDATRTFPFPDSSFDTVSSEHMIEHVSHEQGQFMLRECHRVLKSGGRIRVATPDLQVLLALNTPQPGPVAARYLRWITGRFLPGRPAHPLLVINNAFRNWGHQFLYDAEILEAALAQAGFVEARRHAPGESDDPALRGLEVHGEHIGDQELNAFETMVFEAVCAK